MIKQQSPHIHEAQTDRIEGEIDNSAVTVGDFSTLKTGKTVRQKMTKEVQELNSTLDQLDQIHLQNTSPNNSVIFKHTHGAFSRIDHVAASAKSLQSCLTLCNPVDGSPLGSSVPGILQGRILEWVAVSFSNACMHAKSLQLCLTVRPHRWQPTRFLCPQDSPDKNTGVGCHFLFQDRS